MIAAISELLAMCGFISVRMFLPCFLFLSAMRFWPKWEAGCPALVLEMAKNGAWEEVLVGNVSLINMDNPLAFNTENMVPAG